MAVKIGHASLDENGKIKGGLAGDQTGKEVYIRDYYKFGYNIVLRPKDSLIAEKLAFTVEAACNNPRIGYDQGQRNTLRQQAIANHFNLAAIKTPCECDCSSLMAVCAEAAGINMNSTYSGSNAPTTSTMRKKFAATGAFEVLTDTQYLTSSDYLKRGDILVKEGSHTVCVLSNGTKNTATNNSTNNSLSSAEFNIGDKVTVNGYICSTGKGTGNRIKKTNATMYIVSLVNSKIYSHYIGLSATVNGSRQGWANPESITTKKMQEVVYKEWAAICNEPNTNVRMGPGTNNNILKSWPKLGVGNEVDVINKGVDSNGNLWYQIKIANKHIGWVYGKYLDKR